MSTLLYESLTTQRELSKPRTSTHGPAREAAEGTPQEGKPGVATFVDTLAALVPVEVLAAHAIILGAVTKKSDPVDGPVVVTFDAGESALQWAERFWWILLVAAILLYAVPHAAKGNWDHWDWIRMLIPGAAFGAWTVAQKGTLFDLVASWSNMGRAGAAVGIGLLAILASKVFAEEADKKTK